MKVRDLINTLQSLNQDLPVCWEDANDSEGAVVAYESESTYYAVGEDGSRQMTKGKHVVIGG